MDMHTILTTFLSLQTEILIPDLSSAQLSLVDLIDEITFVASYFLLATEYREPLKMLSRHPAERRTINGYQIQPWLSKEDYLSILTHTTHGRNFVYILLGLL